MDDLIFFVTLNTFISIFTYKNHEIIFLSHFIASSDVKQHWKTLFFMSKKILEKLIWNRKNSYKFFTNPRLFPKNSQDTELVIWAQIGQLCITF